MLRSISQAILYHQRKDSTHYFHTASYVKQEILKDGRQNIPRKGGVSYSLQVILSTLA